MYNAFSLTSVLVYHVHWFRAKARYDRWNEEFTLVPFEMKWTIAYFQKQAEIWVARKEQCTEPGPLCYAIQQSSMWTDFATQALGVFEKVLGRPL